MDVQKLGETVDDLQGRSRDVFVLVREANKYWLTYFFHHLRQENPDRIYNALLTGWIRQVTHPHCLVKLSWICLIDILDAESFLGSSWRYIQLEPAGDSMSAEAERFFFSGPACLSIDAPSIRLKLFRRHAVDPKLVSTSLKSRLAEAGLCSNYIGMMVHT